MLPELGVWDKNSANGMAGAIASTMVLDIMTFARTTAGINKGRDSDIPAVRSRENTGRIR